MKQDLQKLHRRRLADVVDVLLVGHAEEKNLRVLDRLAALVERVDDLADDPVGHVGVDLAGEFDEPRVDAVLARLPRQVERVDGNAMAADAGAREVRREAERLGRRGADDFLNIDAHLVGDDLHLVDEADVHDAMNVLEQLRELGGARGADRNDLVDHLAVERDAGFEAGRA